MISYTAHVRNQDFTYKLFRVNGKLYYSISGATATYKEIKKVKELLLKSIYKNFPSVVDLVSLIFTDNELVSQDDHFFIKTLRNIFNITEDKAQATVTPGPFNAVRSNNRFKISPYTGYDFRIDKTNKGSSSNLMYNRGYTFRSLLQERADQIFANWVQTLHERYPTKYPIIDVLLPSLQNGFDQALLTDFLLYDKFFQQFESSVNHPQSILIFQNQCLIQAKKISLELFQEHKDRYGKDKQNIISKNYAIKVFFIGRTPKIRNWCFIRKLNI